MKIRTGLRIVAGLTGLMMVQAFVLTFWCESASVFAFRVEDLTPLERRGEVLRYPIAEFKSTIPGLIDFTAILVLALLILRQKRLSLIGLELTPRLFGFARLRDPPPRRDRANAPRKTDAPNGAIP